MSINICKKIRDTKDKIKIFHSPDNRGDKKHVKKLKNEEFKYPIQATGVQVLYSSKECKNQTHKKVLMSESGYLRPFYDNGVLGVGGHCFCCLVETQTEGEYIIKLLESKLYTFYININKWSGFHHVKVLQDIPYIKIDDINDEKIYKYFKLNEEEIKFVESVITKKEEIKINYNIIKYKRKNYYLVENKVYNINKNKSQGELFGNYVNENEIKLIKETKVSGYNDIIPIDVNEPKIIKDGLKQYYLIDNKLYKVKKDKTQGDLFGSYKDGKIIEGIDEPINVIIVKDTKNKSKNNEEVNIIENNDEILTVSKKKTSKSKINIIDDNEINTVSKKKTSKSKINII
jgi:hypothetical protein